MTTPITKLFQPELASDTLIRLAEELTMRDKSSYYPIKRRIAYVVSHGFSYASNGYAVRTQGIAKALNEHGLEALCFVRPGRPWDLGEGKTRISIEAIVEGVRYIHSPWKNGRRPDGEVERMTLMIEIFKKLFSIYRPQMVLAASDHETALPAFVAARQLNLPYHYEVRGFWELSRISSDPSWRNTINFLNYQNRERWLCSHASHLYTLNRFMREELVRRGAAEEKISLVPNSVTEQKVTEPLEYKDPKTCLGIPKDTFVVGYIGALTEYEGIDLLLDALAHPKCATVHALIIGGKSPIRNPKAGHSESIIENLALHAGRLGVSNRVTFTGRVPHEDLPGYYRVIDTMIIPRKPLPVCELVSAIKPLEYLAWGKPIIASDVAPQAELLEFGRLGWLFKKGNPEALADTIEMARNASPETRKTMSDNGRTTVRSHYLWRNTVQPIVQQLREECQRHKAPRLLVNAII